jgi:uncharacterized integral membrane protein
MSMSQPDERPTRANAKAAGGAIATGGGVAALAAFVLQNTDDVPVSFLFWEFTWPVWLLIVVSAIFGAIVWFGAGVMRRRRRRKERRS